MPYLLSNIWETDSTVPHIKLTEPNNWPDAGQIEWRAERNKPNATPHNMEMSRTLSGNSAKRPITVLQRFTSSVTRLVSITASANSINHSSFLLVIHLSTRILSGDGVSMALTPIATLTRYNLT